MTRAILRLVLLLAPREFRDHYGVQIDAGADDLKRTGDPGGAGTAAVLTRYLRQRFDLAVTEPTPAEVADCLQHAGASDAVVLKATGLLDACDGARFAPAAAGAALATDAIHFIQTLEADLCAARPS